LRLFTGDDRTNAVTRTLEMLLLARRMDASSPMFTHLDLATPDGVAACARIAEGTKDRATAERCADALDGLPPKAKGDYFGAGTIIPEVVGRAGRGRQLGTGPRSHSGSAEGRSKGRVRQAGEIWPFARAASRKVFVSGSPESGAYLVRMLVLGGQQAEATSIVAAARDDAVRNSGADAEAEALAETGDPAAALPLANTITDPVLRARALAAVADAMKS
jgi:hypothetical protein